MQPAISPIVTAAIAAAFTLSAAATVFAQQTTVVEKTVVEQKVVAEAPTKSTTTIEFQPASSAHDLNVQMLRDFENVKADHGVATDIARNPTIVNDRAYVAQHPALQAFLVRYPAARDEIMESPGNFVTPVAGSKWNSHEVSGIPRD